MKPDELNLIDFLSENFDDLSSSVIPLWHPLGFVSCVIDQLPSSHVARVHYWPAGERRVKNPDWPIHTHSYTLTSTILRGAVRDMQYRASAGNQWCVYSVNYYDGGSEIIQTSEMVDLVTEVDSIRISGTQYEVPRGVYHQTLVPFDQSALTVVLLTEHSSEPPKVLGANLQKRYPYDRIPFSSERFWSAVYEGLEYNNARI